MPCSRPTASTISEYKLRGKPVVLRPCSILCARSYARTTLRTPEVWSNRSSIDSTWPLNSGTPIMSSPEMARISIRTPATRPFSISTPCPESTSSISQSEGKNNCDSTVMLLINIALCSRRGTPSTKTCSCTPAVLKGLVLISLYLACPSGLVDCACVIRVKNVPRSLLVRFQSAGVIRQVPG